MDKLEKVRAHRTRMHDSIVRTVEQKIATAAMYGMAEDEAALRTCLEQLRKVQP